MTKFHQDADLFREATRFTNAQTGFSTRLIEKDYFCTVLLEYLTAAGPSLVFKGGTCLAKVHADFYRLSEDLDFMVSVPLETTRSERRTYATALKQAVTSLPRQVPTFRIVQPLTGANNSTQYIALLGYSSLLSGQEETVKIEVSLREPLLTPPLITGVQTVMLDPVSGKPLVHPVKVTCISRIEAFAEKFRAALSRRDVAIRDFFDIDFAVRKLNLVPDDPVLVNLIRQKLASPGNELIDVSTNRLMELRRQLEPQLKPVLRDRDFREFDFDRAFGTVTEMATAVETERI